MIIDRIEGGFAVCEKDDKEMVNIPLSDLPHGAKQGCVISIIDGSYVIDLEETKDDKKLFKIDLVNFSKNKCYRKSCLLRQLFLLTNYQTKFQLYQKRLKNSM